MNYFISDMATAKKDKKVTKMTRAQLNEMINFEIDQRVVNYIVESSNITLKDASRRLNESIIKDGLLSLRKSCQEKSIKSLIFTATKSLQAAANLLEGEAKTDMQSIVNVLRSLTAEQKGERPQQNPQAAQQNIQ